MQCDIIYRKAHARGEVYGPLRKVTMLSGFFRILLIVVSFLPLRLFRSARL